MVTMAKKAKKVRSEVIVTPEQVSALAGQESEEEVKPVKKQKKKKTKDSAECSEISETDSLSLADSSNHQTGSKPTNITKSSKENMKVGSAAQGSFKHIPVDTFLG